jgi:phosphomannomutase/phosphoglucomutase
MFSELTTYEEKQYQINPQLTSDFALELGKALGTYFLRLGRNSFAVARDGRLTSEELQSSLIKGLSQTGIKITNLGLSPSPMFYFAVCQDDFDCGCVVTASHNPKDDNGFKIVDNNAHSVWGDQLQVIYQMMIQQDYDLSDSSSEVFTGSVFDKYIAHMQSELDIQRPLKVVIDTGNGINGPFIEKLIENKNLDITVIYKEIDGNFPNHPANPEKEKNMLDLSAKVRELGADIGLGFDGDADRLGMVDENGKFYTCDLLLMLLAQDFLSRNPGQTVIFDTKVSKVVENQILEASGVPYRYMTGHSLIEKQMHEKNIKFGGEISGHFFFGENYYGFDDATLATVRLLNLISKSDKKVSDYFINLPHVFVTPEVRIDCADNRKFIIVEEIINKFKDSYKLITLDGMFLDYNSHTWGVCRASNTAGQLTLRFESQTKEDLITVIDLIASALDAYPELNTKDIHALKNLF